MGGLSAEPEWVASLILLVRNQSGWPLYPVGTEPEWVASLSRWCGTRVGGLAYPVSAEPEYVASLTLAVLDQAALILAMWNPGVGDRAAHVKKIPSMVYDMQF